MPSVVWHRIYYFHDWQKVFDFPIKNFQIESIAQTYRKTPEQILLRYQIQRGHIAIPISISKLKLRENMDIFKFELASHDMAALGKLDRNKNYSSLNALSYVKMLSFVVPWMFL